MQQNKTLLDRLQDDIQMILTFQNHDDESIRKAVKSIMAMIAIAKWLHEWVV